MLPRSLCSISLLRENSKTSKSHHVVPLYMKIPVRHNSFFAGIYSEISNSTCVHLCQQNLICVHDYTGMPWWATIILTTFVLRTIITFPLAVYSNKIAIRVENIALEMPAIAEELKSEVARAKHLYNLTDQNTQLLYRRSLSAQWKKLIERENCHPFKMSVVIWAQIPLWICQSVAVRNMLNMLPDPNSIDAQIVYTMLSVGGFGWIPNLTAVDSTFILPITFGILNLVNIELMTLTKSTKPGRLQTVVTSCFRVIVIAMIPIAATVPSCLTLYWTASSAYSLAQNLILVSPKVKRILRIAATSKDHMETPYRTIALRFSNNMQRRREYIKSILRLKN